MHNIKSKLLGVFAFAGLVTAGCGVGLDGNDLATSEGAISGSSKAAEVRLLARLEDPNAPPDASESDAGVPAVETVYNHGQANYRDRSGQRELVVQAEGTPEKFVAGQLYSFTLITAGGARIALGQDAAECTQAVEGLECEVKLSFKGNNFPAGFPARLAVGDSVCVDDLCGDFVKN